MDRRRFVSLAAMACGGLAGCAQRPMVPRLATASRESEFGTTPLREAGLIEDLARRTFVYFWETTDARTGLAPDRYPTESACSIAAVGFALTAYPIGVQRGYVTREQALERTLTTLRFLRDLPQGPQATGTCGYKGFFYHFLEMRDGLRAGDSEISTVDTALFVCGALYVQAFFDADVPEEIEVRRIVDEIVDRIDWRWAQIRPPSIALGWTPEKGFLPYDWRGYNEAAVLYLLALGARENAVDASAWGVWTSSYNSKWSTFNGQQALHFPPLFGHQYSAIWVDFRGINDAFLRSRGTDYFENSRRATYAQRAYAILNPGRWIGYGPEMWGLTACDGPGNMLARYLGDPRRFRGYWARGAGGSDAFDDGTIAPTAAAASIAFAPEIVLPVIEAMVERYGEHIYGRYGFVDSFNPSFRFDVDLAHGRVIPDVGWVATDHLGIDQGPILAMIANYTNGSVWQAMDQCEILKRGLKRAGFTGGWLDYTS
jgi:hypothetical protein